MRWSRSSIFVAVIGVVLGGAGPVFAQGSTLGRAADPVVLEGSELGCLVGLPVDGIVGFRYDGAWQQVPVQVDERRWVDFGVVYNGTLPGGAPLGLTTLSYADPDTYVGADDVAGFDADDELVLMAADAGGAAPAGAGPGGAVPPARVEVTITDPLDGGRGYLYLFAGDGSLAPDAGADRVAYDFHLLAGSYIPDYNLVAGPNPEDSVVVTDHYRTHFSDRWIRDELEVLAGAATGADILDRHKNMFAPGVCARTENTFSDGEGAFFANLDGPLRAVRSYMGANSGPLTERAHRFYRRRHEIETILRVHEIPGIMDLYDYSPAAAGMTYFNDLDPAGVTVDGMPDPVTAGALGWEMVTGPQGSVIISHALDTDIESFAYTSYYSDDAMPPPLSQCTGDAFEYGTSGLWIDQTIPNTDPWFVPGPPNRLVGRRVVTYEAPGATAATAQLRHQQAATPLAVTAVCGDLIEEDPIFADGFESGDTSAWSAAVP